MANISFLVKGSGAINEQHAAKAWVTIEEMTGGLYFDICDETIMNTLQVKAMSMNIRIDEDSMIGTKNGTDLTETFTANTRSMGAKEVIREYAFTLQSRKRALALSDFSCMQLDYSDRNGSLDTTVNDDDSHRWLYLALL